MDLLTDSLRAALRANAEAACQPRHDPVPAVKFFNPCGAATWLATELDADGDTLFGLADLGFGCPELGSFSLAEIASVRLPFGLRIERDLFFSTTHPLSKWAEAARQAGSILAAERLLDRESAPLDGDGGTELPDPAGSF
jgi:hypothetical protein